MNGFAISTISAQRTDEQCCEHGIQAPSRLSSNFSDPKFGLDVVYELLFFTEQEVTRAQEVACLRRVLYAGGWYLLLIVRNRSQPASLLCRTPDCRGVSPAIASMTCHPIVQIRATLSKCQRDD